MMRSRKKTVLNKKYVIIAAISATLLLASTAGAWYYLSQKDVIKRDENGVSIERTPQDHALEEQLNEDPDRKEEATQTDHPAAPTVNEATNLQNANVVLTNVNVSNGKVNSSGFVSNIVETEGTCTYMYTKGQVEIKKEINTLPNPSSTTCRAMQFESGELTAGEWMVKIIYKSSSSYGESNQMKLLVP